MVRTRRSRAPWRGRTASMKSAVAWSSTRHRLATTRVSTLVDEPGQLLPKAVTVSGVEADLPGVSCKGRGYRPVCAPRGPRLSHLAVAGLRSLGFPHLLLVEPLASSAQSTEDSSVMDVMMSGGSSSGCCDLDHPRSEGGTCGEKCVKHPPFQCPLLGATSHAGPWTVFAQGSPRRSGPRRSLGPGSPLGERGLGLLEHGSPIPPTGPHVERVDDQAQELLHGDPPGREVGASKSGRPSMAPASRWRCGKEKGLRLPGCQWYPKTSRPSASSRVYMYATVRTFSGPRSPSAWTIR